MFSIDLNCDMGESFGAWQMGRDGELMDYVSSVNVACGFHAGDASVVRKTIETAIKKKWQSARIRLFPICKGFGRRAMSLSAEEVFDIVLYQVSAVKGICEAFGAPLHHVKPHGALYNQAAKDAGLAEAIAQAVKAIDENLILYGLSNSFLVSEAERINLKTASEVFADRTYQADGILTARSEPNALICDMEKAVSQVLEMIEKQSVTATTGEIISLRAETVCIHGDGENALRFARAIRQKLAENGVLIQTV